MSTPLFIKYIEVRPGEGGADAQAFAGEISHALEAYAKSKGAIVTRTTSRTTTLVVRSKKPLPLGNATGVHRVQRIPKGSAARHTSTATVAVLDAPSTDDIYIDNADVEMTTYRGSGAGGQHRNVTDSAVRLIHAPSGIIVTSENSRSQARNLLAAREELARRLTEASLSEQSLARNGARRSQVTTAERPARQWTWNTQRGEVTDHTSGVVVPLRAALRGRLDPLLDAA